jgi:hypothetical protein
MTAPTCVNAVSPRRQASHEYDAHPEQVLTAAHRIAPGTPFRETFTLTAVLGVVRRTRYPRRR